MAQEVSVGYDWMQAAKDLAKAEKDLGVQKWVLITFYRKNEKGESEKIFEYDLPRELWIKWNWVINWRRAKLICMFPRGEVYNTMSFYDKRSGYETGIMVDWAIAKGYEYDADIPVDEVIELLNIND